MKNYEFRLCHIHLALNGNRRLLRRFMKEDPDLILPYSKSIDQLASFLQIPLKKSTRVFQFIHSSNMKSLTTTYFQQGIVLTNNHPMFPSYLNQIPDPPMVLFFNGDLSLLSQSPSLSVVGTRTPSSKAYPKMKSVLTPLIERGCVIVSGMARGIDTFAHKLTIDSGGRTIAVLAFGFNHCYPLENQRLMEELRRDHLLVSEYPPHIKPQKWHFPERNRLISGLSKGTLVIEAKERSGSLITVDQALEQGKEVYAVPGEITSPMSVGCHRLIQQGAKLVQSSYDIEEDWL
ncbi:DNA-processing protein DprA [Pontibacillus yanchengensis]|uniref:DNA processing protein n=1 Tax=Pontibacillus yanchengensis Y32 TaxID=1385514 RepID=A0A0A2THR8_9BACI|nr:DNA-processing protein DprA [Pontibacillus yanchengensis]KGP73978.1 DNA processing protein [Pontibacillus yanchengensis Y32]